MAIFVCLRILNMPKRSLVCTNEKSGKLCLLSLSFYSLCPHVIYAHNKTSGEFLKRRESDKTPLKVKNQ
jgi:hypothetical protein